MERCFQALNDFLASILKISSVIRFGERMGDASSLVLDLVALRSHGVRDRITWK
jgi:hypothetical protein